MAVSPAKVLFALSPAHDGSIPHIFGLNKPRYVTFVQGQQQRDQPTFLLLHYSPQVKSPQKLFNLISELYFLCFSTNTMPIYRQFSCFRFYFVYDFEYYIFADVQGGSVCWCHRWGTPTAASGSSSPTLTAGTYQVAVRVLWHEGGGTHDEREDTRQCETKNHSFQLLTIFREWIVWEQTHFPS